LLVGSNVVGDIDGITDGFMVDVDDIDCLMLVLFVLSVVLLLCVDTVSVEFCNGFEVELGMKFDGCKVVVSLAVGLLS